MRLRAIAATAVFGALAACPPTPGAPFDPVAWAEADYGSGDRLPMADELLRSRALIGKTRAEVVTLLGEPPTTSYFSDWDMVYLLDPCRCLFPVDDEWLVVRLDNGRASEVRIVQD